MAKMIKRNAPRFGRMVATATYIASPIAGGWELGCLVWPFLF